MVLPLLAWGAIAVGSAVAGGTAIGLTSKPDQVTNNSFQETYQQDYITNETTFDFSNGYFENGSVIDLSNYIDVETSKNASQEATQTGSPKQNTTLNKVLIGALVVGAGYYAYRRFVK